MATTPKPRLSKLPMTLALSHCFQTIAYLPRRVSPPRHSPRHFPLPLAMPRGSAKGRQATHRQRIDVYAKLGWKYPPIPFMAPSKRDLTIGGRWVNNSMSKGSCLRNHSNAIGMTYQFPKERAPSMPTVASFKGCSRRSKKEK
jgi:hypothetical protein